jgi:hypothetical protein
VDDFDVAETDLTVRSRHPHLAGRVRLGADDAPHGEALPRGAVVPFADQARAIGEHRCQGTQGVEPRHLLFGPLPAALLADAAGVQA